VALGLARFAYALLLPSMRTELHWSFAIAGAMNTANAFGYLAGALLAAPTARRWGTRRSFLVGLGITVVSLLATAATGNAAVLVGLRALAGVSGAICFVTGAGIVAEAGTAGSARRAASLLGIYFAGGGAGIVVSGLAIPFLLAATPAADGWRWGWVLLAGLGLVALGIATPAARATREPRPAPQADKHWPARHFRPLLACYALFGAGYIAYMTFIVALLKHRGAGPGEITAFWVVLGAASIAGAFLWVRPVVSLRGGRAPGVVLAVVSAGAFLPLVSRSPEAAAASAVLFGGSFLAVVTAVTVVVRRSLQPHHWTPAIATLTVAFALGQCAGPVLAGVLSDGPAGLRAGLGLSAGILVAGAFVAVTQRHYQASAGEEVPGMGPLGVQTD
jgi:predicted MFS family arabinose efflux permease